MKKALSLIIAIIASNFLNAQPIPELSEADFIQKSDIGKKVGWTKVGLDDKFMEASSKEHTKYILYDFVDKKGNYISTYRDKIAFPKNAFKVTYEPTVQNSKSMVLDGTITFYNKNGEKYLLYQVLGGFIMKIYEFNSEGQLKTAIEYIPGKTSVELFANYYGKDGKSVTADSHESYDGYKYITLAGSKDIK